MAKPLERVVFIGVIHTDLDSVQEARETVKQVRPDVVAVELDRDRYQQMMHPPSEEEAARMTPIGEPVQDLFQQIALLERSLGDITGSNAGAEMLAAIEEGRRIGAKIALVDRPIQATIQAIMNVPLDEVYRMFSMMPGASKEIHEGGAEDLLSMLKEEGAVDAVMEEFRTQFPNLSNVLIQERDNYVAKALFTILNDVEGRIVVVLGAGHIQGVKQSLARMLETRAGA